MNTITKKIEIDLYSPSINTIKAQQGDNNTRYIEFSLFHQGIPYAIPDNIAVKMEGHRGNGSSFIKDDCINIIDNKIHVTLKEDILCYAGIIEAKIVMYDTENEMVLSSVPFKILCQKSPCDKNNLTQGEKSLINDLIFKVEEFSKNAELIISQAQKSADEAAVSADNAANSVTIATQKSTEASNSATMADTKADEAANSATIADTKAVEASDSATQSKSYAVGETGTRDAENIDNAKYYYEQSKSISEELSGVLRPRGTVVFENLPALSSVTEGDMYNISDQFTTNNNFKEGSGIIIPAGSNVYKTADGQWDVLAGSPVTGVKGNEETSYRKGNVNITKADIGLENVENFKAVSTAASQELTDTEKANARNNIGVGTWTANTKDSEGYVAKGSGQANKVWKTDANGNPAWREESTVSENYLPLSGGTLTGDLRIKGSSNYGTKINLGNSDYVHISEPTDDCLEIKAKKINLVTSDTSSSGFTWNNGSAVLPKASISANSFSKTAYVNLSTLMSSGEDSIILVTARSHIAVNGGARAWLLTTINNNTWHTITILGDDNYNGYPTFTFSGPTATITFYDTAGGVYSFVRLN